MVGRFTGVDPIADQFAWVSPYNYAENSPVANIDLWGLQAVFAGDGSNIIIGYRIPKNYGVTQIAEDLNTNYGCYFDCEVQAADIMYNNLQYFPEKNEFGDYPGALTDRNDFGDAEHSPLNMNELEYIDLSFTLENQPAYRDALESFQGNNAGIEQSLEAIRPLDSTLAERKHDQELKNMPSAIRLPRGDSDRFRNGEAAHDGTWNIRNLIQQQRLHKQIEPLQRKVDSLKGENAKLPEIVKH